MKNPWAALPVDMPFVLADDRDYVSAFNAEMDDRHRLDLAVLPQPFLGNHASDLLVLSRNPGERGWDRGDYADALREEITSERGRHVPPLLPPYVGREGRWWAKCFRSVLDHLGKDSAWLSEKVLGVEFHGYHSQSYKALPITLPSQHYGFDLVEQAVERGANIVIMRGGRDWRIAIPALMKADPIVLANPQSATLSPRNCGAEGFERILQAVA